MPANTQPIFSAQGSLQWAATALTAANIAKDGTGTVTTIATGNASGNAAGNFIQKLVCQTLGANVATVLRVFVNNGGVNTTAANNVLLGQVTLPATTLTETAGQAAIEIPLMVALPPSYKINCTLGTAVAAGWQVTAVGGQY